MHASTGFPAAQPVTVTASTVPIELNLTIAWEIGSSPSTHASAAQSAGRIALLMAPIVGKRGATPSGFVGARSSDDGFGDCASAWAASSIWSARLRLLCADVAASAWGLVP